VSFSFAAAWNRFVCVDQGLGSALAMICLEKEENLNSVTIDGFLTATFDRIGVFDCVFDRNKECFDRFDRKKEA
jgi:hypothetical protein